MSVIARVVMLGLLLCLPVGANAVETGKALEVGIGLICNSEAQVQRFLALQGVINAPIRRSKPSTMKNTIRGRVHWQQLSSGAIRR
jgi:hypothetical protein